MKIYLAYIVCIRSFSSFSCVWFLQAYINETHDYSPICCCLFLCCLYVGMSYIILPIKYDISTHNSDFLLFLIRRPVSCIYWHNKIFTCAQKDKMQHYAVGFSKRWVFKSCLNDHCLKLYDRTWRKWVTSILNCMNKWRKWMPVDEIEATFARSAFLATKLKFTCYELEWKTIQNERENLY